MKPTLKLLAILAILGLPAIASAECSSADKEVGFVDGNNVSSDCVEVAAMVPTEPDPTVVNPTPEQEPNPNPSAGEGEDEGGEGDGEE